jgi:hypothetical protein
MLVQVRTGYSRLCQVRPVQASLSMLEEVISGLARVYHIRAGKGRL